MKLVRGTATPVEAPVPALEPPWKILVVDNDTDVRRLSALNLRDVLFENRRLELIEAGSAVEALGCLERHPDIAVALIDIVMETDDAGLRLVETIRRVLGNETMRLILRTGQPVDPPTRYVIEHFDIDDYKDKVDLTARRLRVTVQSALRAYLELNRAPPNAAKPLPVLETAPAS
jgi:CheY-like chemotaxis protein